VRPRARPQSTARWARAVAARTAASAHAALE
jgi:hypothetical protein